MNQDALFWVCMYSGVLVNELLYIGRNQKQIKSVHSYILDRWDEVAIALLTAVPLGLGADWIFAQVSLSGINTYLGAYVLGVSGVILLSFVKKKIKTLTKNDTLPKA